MRENEGCIRNILRYIENHQLSHDIVIFTFPNFMGKSDDKVCTENYKNTELAGYTVAEIQRNLEICRRRGIIKVTDHNNTERRIKR